MRASDLIRKKRDGGVLGAGEIGFLIKGLLSGEIPDYQITAFLMAACIKGLDNDETFALTEAMLRSGTVLDLSGINGTKVDKHSTGGVGDKTSLILAPLMAAMGLKVPMISGRALGHTGGTLDKLDAIPGMRTDITVDEFKSNIQRIGFSIMGQTSEIAPADRRLYALRDVTATVESIPLIAASIMSKKLAEGLDGLVLDVKCGAGAFIKGHDDARELASTMVKIGKRFGVATVAVITDMAQPLGKTVGNALEVKECLTALKGMGAPDLMEVTLTLGAWMLHVADSTGDDVEPRALDGQTFGRYRDEAADFIGRGDAFKKFVEFIDAQHGDAETAFKPAMMPGASHMMRLDAPRSGYVRELDAEAVGRASGLLGAGRERAEDGVDLAAGIILNKKIGDKVEQGEPLAMFHLNDEACFNEAKDVFLAGLVVGPSEPEPRRLIHGVVLK